MKFKISKSLKEKISTIKSRVKEPEQFEKIRTYLFAFTLIFTLVWMPIQFIVVMGADYKPTFFLCGFVMMGLLILTSMIQPDSKSFWLIFLNMFIGMPLVTLFFPFEIFMSFSDAFEALFGLIPLWIPIVYLFYYCWDKKKRNQRYKEDLEVRMNKLKASNIEISGE